MTKNKKALYGAMLPTMELACFCAEALGDISTHTLSSWIKSKTNDEYVIVPRKIALNMLEYIDNNSVEDVEFVRNCI